jgi:hypothetical protein
VEPTNILPIVAVLSLVTVEYGGWALLTFITELTRAGAALIAASLVTLAVGLIETA